MRIKTIPRFLRDKIKNSDVSLVDLAEFLDISRPTMYKFIELYELGQRDKLDSRILALFDFVNAEQELDKPKILSYIVEHIIKPRNPYQRNELIQSLIVKDNPTKVELIDILCQESIYEPILEYLLKCQNIIYAKSGRRKVFSKAEKDTLAPLCALYYHLGLKLI